MKNYKAKLRKGIMLLTLFVLWTLLIQTVDVQPAGEIIVPLHCSALRPSSLRSWDRSSF